MATPHPSPDGRSGPSPRGRVVVTTFSVVGVSALVLATVAALSLWLLLTDPMTASAVVERGDALPLARSLLVAVGNALVKLLAFL
jgi:hypothetical protein